MKKRLAVLMGILFLGIMGSVVPNNQVSAQETAEQDYSYLLAENVIIGEMSAQTRGVYLSSGMSTIEDPGPGKIISGGITSAARQCKVSINVIVERLVNGNWVRVTSWTATKDYAWTVGSSKTLSVGKGYYYRTRCIHYAASDVSSSITSGLWR